MIGARFTTEALRLAGWRYEGDRPREKKFVMLAAPHTSNWDGLLLLALTRSIDLSMSWMIKEAWVKGPMGIVLRRLGAVAIDRAAPQDVVPRMIAELRAADEMVLVIPPEGTRRRADAWKSGFYRIAHGANVPVVPGYLDYGRKRAGLGHPIWLTGDVHADMDRIRAFYKQLDPQGRFPDQFGPIRLRDEGTGG